MEVAVEGEREAVKARDFDAIVGPWIEPGYRLAVAMLRDSDQARAWFLSIVANQCRSTMRRRWWSVVRLPAKETAGADPEEPAVRYLDLERAMNRLSSDDRAILHLYYFLDLPIDEVARVIGIRVGAAKTRIYRAVHRLRPDLELMEEDLR
jgi:RNA polymerase sigma-70 factor (ECF subfamily)